MTGNRILAAFGLTALFFAVFHSALQIPFAMHNDLGAFTYDNKHHFLGWPEGSNLFTIGRALNAVIAWCYFYFINSISDFATGRALSVITLAVAAFCGSLWLRRLGLDAVVAFAVASSLFLLPTAQIAVVWQTQFVPLISPLFLLLPAGYLLYRNASGTGIRGTTERAVHISVALIMTVASFFIYQLTPFILLLPPFAAVLFTSAADLQKTRMLVLRGILFLVVAGIVYYSLQKLLVGPLTAHLVPKQDFVYSLAFTDSFFDNVRLITRSGGLFACNLWNIRLSLWVAGFVIIVIFLGASIEVFRLVSDRSRTRKEKILLAGQYSVTISFLILLGNAPNIAASSPTVAYRTLFCFTAMIALLFFWAIFRIGSLFANPLQDRFIRTGALAILGVAVFSAQANVLNVALNAYQELDYYRLNYNPKKLEQSLDRLDKNRGIELYETAKPELFIEPYYNLSGAYLPLEFGIWQKREEVNAMIEKEMAAGGRSNTFTKYREAGDFYSTAGEYDKAAEMYSLALKQKHVWAEEAEISYSLAFAFLRKGDYASATQFYEAAISQKPWHVRALYHLGLISKNKGDYDKAVRYFKSVLKILPLFLEVRYDLGDAYYRKGQPDLAVQEYLIILRNRPDHARTYYRLGRVYLDQGHFDKALDYFDLAIGKGYETDEVYFGRGRACQLLGNQSAAAIDFDRACQKGSKDACEELGKLEGK